jgi:AraC family transcriptional regulator, regulatory protein of adaptative response / methylated-DNA-[protein]-cysteine methyltransferase
MFQDEDSRRQAVAVRSRAADGKFVYSVETTGVYCRPCCTARTARPENIRFHDTPADAERAGFRPCQRCQPHLLPLAQRESSLVAGVCRLIEEADHPPTLAQLATGAGLSPHHFHRLFKRVTGLTPKAYADATRQRRVLQELESAPSVTDAFYAAGFNSSGRFYEAAPTLLGMTPGAYRRGGEGEAIWYATAGCALGIVLVAATERGICAITLGNTAGELEADLQTRFPKAGFKTPPTEFTEWVDQVTSLVDKGAQPFDLPLDIRGTAFQRRVWEVLRTIPAGQTASYREVARRVGSPQAVRAVASACAANPLAVAIPCHRVISSDGALAGYRWGIERKRWLLETEKGAEKV